MKKIIVGILGLVMLMTAAPIVSASSTWNGASNDCKGLSILNATTNDGYGYPCWPSTSISADAGDTLNVRVYYHNTGSATANNTRVVLNAQLGSASTSKSFSGSISSDQGGLSLGSVTANLSSSQTLTFNSVKWYTNNTSETLTPLLNGQNGSEILNGGLNIGSIASGWATQGSLVVSFHVSNTVAPELCQDRAATNYGGALPCTYPPQVCQDSSATNYGGALPCTYAQKICTINNFTSNPSTITLGGSSTLSWDTTNCISANISQIGTVNVSGSSSVYPTQTTSYQLTAYGVNGVPVIKYTNVTVNQVQKTCVLNNFTANPTSITKGDASTLSWSTTDCDNVTISNLNYNVPTNGTQSVYPTQTTTYMLVASGVNGVNAQTKSVTINVTSAPQLCQDRAAINYGGSLPCTYPPSPVCVINSFTANPASITKGDASFLNWSTNNCTNAVISNLGYGIPTSGSQSIYPTQTTTYTLTAYGASGSALSKSVTVYVSVKQICADPKANNYNGTLPCTYPPQVCKDSTATNYGGTLPCAYPVVKTCVVNSFTAVPVSINKGEPSTLNWSTTNCADVVISNLSYSLPTTGAQEVWPTQTTTYTLTARSTDGTVAPTKTATIYVSINQTCADPTATNYGGALPCTYPTQQLCQDPTAINYHSALPCSYVIIILPTDKCSITDFTASDTSISDGDSSTLQWDTNNCDRVKISSIGDVSDSGSQRVYPSDDTTYTITGYNTDGTHVSDTVRIYVDNNNNNNNNDCSIDSFTASNTYINSNDPVTLRWSTTGCNNVNISNLGSVSLDGSRIVYPTQNTTYVLNAYGNNSVSRSLYVNVNYQQLLPIVPIYNTNVVTTVATNITQTSASINGLVTSTNYNNANVYFEYGTSVNLGSRTASKPTNGNTNFSDYITNLSSNTIYYFQAVSNDQNGISRGAIEVFKTLGYATVNTNTNTNYTNTTQGTTRQVIVQQGITLPGSTSPIVLRIENKYQTIGVGDIVDYVVYYKNISGSVLTHPMVQVTIPQGLTLLNSSRGTYSEQDHIVSVPIEDLYPDAEGVIYIQARVDAIDANLAQIVTTAILVYTNPNGAQENAMAYVLNNPRNVNLLGASAFFGGNILGLGLIGWLIIIILIMLLILAARSYERRNNNVYYPNHNNIPPHN